MSGPSERDEIAEVIAGIDGGRLADATMRAHDACLRAADRILASDWLAERDRRTAAKTLREAADLGPINFAMTHEEPKWRGYNHLVTTQWLRDRADRIEAE